MLMSETKKFRNPFIEAAKSAAANPRVPAAKTQQVQQAQRQRQAVSNRPPRRNTGRGG
jgi:hypothetical protein